MSRSINEREFRRLCNAVEGNVTVILRDRGDLTCQTAMQRELFTRLCHTLEIDMDSAQVTELLEQKTGYSFAIMQTLEENMQPVFLYINTLGPFLQRASDLP